MTYDQGHRAPEEDRARALLLGLLLGDGYDELAGEGAIHGTNVSQLALFTLEGLIRACVRNDTKGICHAPSVVWHAWCRWAHLQGLGEQFARRWGSFTSGGWPDGWLYQVEPLSRRRGSAPATIKALQADPEIPREARTQSNGYHAVTRALPIAALAGAMDDAPQFARDIASLTHGATSAQDAAALTVTVAIRVILDASDPLYGISTASPGARGTAMHALIHGAQAAFKADDLRDALLFAAPHGRGATTVAGALWGAARGLDAFDQGLLARLEVGWVADRLARDAVLEASTHPAEGMEFGAPSDPTWWARYPGW